jgi:putative oxidoreductase
MFCCLTWQKEKTMSQALRGPLTVAGRVLLCTIFLMAAVGNKIPNFSDVAKIMESAGVPAPQFLLAGAIVFLVVGSLSVIVGYKARVGAALLFTFLVLASYYFHAFWKVEGQAQQEQMIHFMKNLSMMGAMLFIMANGSGPMSLDSLLHKWVPLTAEEPATFTHSNVA